MRHRTTRDMVLIEGAEDYTDVPRRTLRAAVNRGDLRAYRPGGGQYSRLYFDLDDLDAWLASVEVGA